jgi:phosphomannomutase / phosphoglucomutase
MKIPPEIFREYDIRGIVDRDLNIDVASQLGKAVGTVVRRGGGKKLIVGQDARSSGVAFVAAFSEGVRSTGCDVVQIGVTPTPVNYWAIAHLKTDGGVQITGSHNPAEYNGFKLTLLGESVHGQGIQQLRQLIDAQDFEQGQGNIQTRAMLQAYLDDLATILKPAARKFKIVVDAGNGVGGLTGVPLYRCLGYDVVPLFCEPDGSFPNHHADPTVEKNLEALKQAVAAEKADLGIAFDGDADRIGIIDKQGEVVWGDELLILLARDVLKQVPKSTIIAEVKCSKTLYDDIALRGGKALMWRTGHSLIKNKMKECGAALAGEMSGHIFYKHRYYGFDDAVYAGGRLLEILSSSTKTITEHLSDVPKSFSTPEIRIDCREAQKFILVQKVLEMFRAQTDGTVIDIDGVRVEWPDGFGLVRPSNTQPLLVLRFEAQTEQRLREIQDIFEQKIAEVQQRL